MDFETWMKGRWPNAEAGMYDKLREAWQEGAEAERESLREPTDEMIFAGYDAGWWSGCSNGREEAGNVWKAMLSAAPPLPANTVLSRPRDDAEKNR